MPEEEAIKRIMPHNSDAEASVISAMVLDREAIGKAAEIVSADDFYNRQYGIMFDSILELESSGMDVDAVTLQNKLKEKNLPPEVYSTEAIGNMLVQLPTSANVESYAKIVADKALLRRLIKAGSDVAQDCYMENKPAQDILQEAEKSVFDLSQKRGGSDFQPIREIVLEAMDDIAKASQIKGNVTGIPTGFTELDNKTAGLQPADLILIAARPSMGKTALALNIAEHVALDQHKSVAIFSLEMSRKQLVNRLLAMEALVDAQKIRTGELEDGEWQDLFHSASVIGGSHLIIDDTPAISVSAMRTRCMKYKMDFGLDLVMVDYLQLMSSSGRSNTDSRQQEISEISRSLKALARELKVPVIALSQLSRAVESRTDKRPMLSDLRESGAIEQDADVVMFIYREDYYKPDTEKKGIAEINIAKQRNGPTGVVELRWRPELTKFANLAPAQGQQGSGF